MIIIMFELVFLLFFFSPESHTRWTRLGNLTNERQFRFQTDDLIAIDRERDEIFYLGRKTLTKKRLGIMINFEYIEKVGSLFLDIDTTHRT